MSTAADEAATFDLRWRSAASAFGDRPFLEFADAGGTITRWSYAQWDQIVARTAGFLSARGVGKGDSVHLALTNSPAFLAVWFACIRLGAVMVPSDPRATEREIRTHLQMTHPLVGVHSIERAEAYVHAAAASDVRTVVAVSEDAAGLEPLLGDALGTSAELHPTDPAGVLFTSGTTSAPKGVVITQGNYAFTGDVMGRQAGLRPESRVLVVLPLFHANAQYYTTTAAVSYGACVCLVANFSASRFLEQCATHRASHASLFAAPMRMILARTAPDAPRVSLEHCWYAQNLAPEQLDEFEQLVGCRPRQLYGMTETIAAVVTQRAGDRATDAIGRATPGCDVDLRLPDEDTLAEPGEEGEITIGGIRGLTLFAEYLNNPEATSAAFLGGRFRTGDYAVSQPDGTLRFVGRRGDTLKVAGENVAIVEVEEALMSHPGVLDAAVIGQPDPIRDEVPIAFVVRAGDGQLDAEELMVFAEGILAPAKRPRAIHFVDQLPRTSVGKIRRFMLAPPAAQR